jgi:glutathione S-transferase
VKLTLFVVHNSHPCAAVEKALQLKGLAYRVVEWPPPLHAALQRPIFGARTVPGLVIDRRERISGSRRILRRLDELVAEPRLYPPDKPGVVEAERWGDEEFQQVARDLIWAGAAHRPDALVSYSKGGRIPLPPPAVRALAPGITAVQRRLNRTDDAKATRRLAELPAQIARIDAWIADGTIGDPRHPNAADLQILSTVRLLASFDDARPALEGSAALRAAEALWPPVAGRLPAGALA